MKKNNKGFSLVELIVVIAIMAILAAVAIPTFAGFIGKAQTANDESFLNDVKYAVELGYAEEGGLPSGYVLQLTIAGGKVTTLTLVDADPANDPVLADQAVSTGILNNAVDLTIEMKKLVDGEYISTGDGHWTKTN